MGDAFDLDPFLDFLVPDLNFSDPFLVPDLKFCSYEKFISRSGILLMQEIMLMNFPLVHEFMRGLKIC